MPLPKDDPVTSSQPTEQSLVLGLPCPMEDSVFVKKESILKQISV